MLFNTPTEVLRAALDLLDRYLPYASFRYPHAGVVGPMAHGHVNVSPEHMPLGPADHLLHLQRLAARGERDES